MQRRRHPLRSSTAPIEERTRRSTVTRGRAVSECPKSGNCTPVAGDGGMHRVVSHPDFDFTSPLHLHVRVPAAKNVNQNHSSCETGAAQSEQSSRHSPHASGGFEPGRRGRPTLAEEQGPRGVGFQQSCSCTLLGECGHFDHCRRWRRLRCRWSALCR